MELVSSNVVDTYMYAIIHDCVHEKKFSALVVVHNTTSTGTFDVVVVNFYPFYEKVSNTSGITFEDGIENIDIGGTAMLRAAAKNHKDVLVAVDFKDYPALLEFLKGERDDSQQFRRRLAWKAFQHVASYDSAISEWLWKQSGGDKFSPSLTGPLSLKSSLRCGENPHQKATFYVDKSLSEVNAGGIATGIQHHGKVRKESGIASLVFIIGTGSSLVGLEAWFGI
ncbi:uncharacterized protein LOC143885597 [Tasmannia lanceolata]|uniref:uncharacterized protein LOC143885597 n=1 Tax=Tasmannia lanceolata TaxID=3420 RepID=UPI00406367F9